MLSILIAVAGVLVATVLVVAGVMRGEKIEDMVPTGAVVAILGLVIGFGVTVWGKKAARKQRPEWLETKAWHAGLEAKLAKSQLRDEAKPGSAAPAAPRSESEQEKGPRPG